MRVQRLSQYTRMKVVNTSFYNYHFTQIKYEILSTTILKSKTLKKSNIRYI